MKIKEGGRTIKQTKCIYMLASEGSSSIYRWQILTPSPSQKVIRTSLTVTTVRITASHLLQTSATPPGSNAQIINQ
jgi:hypothetical protein